MGTALVKGVSAGLLITALTMMGGMLYTSLGWGEPVMSTLLDIGLVLSCVAAGYRAGKAGEHWLWGGIAALLYIGVGLLVLSLFVSLSSWGAVQVAAEGGLIGILAGAVGAGRKSKSRGARTDRGKGGSYFTRRASVREEADSHLEDWRDWDLPPEPPRSPFGKRERRARPEPTGKAFTQEREGISTLEEKDRDGRMGPNHRVLAEEEWDTWMSSQAPIKKAASERAWWEA